MKSLLGKLVVVLIGLAIFGYAEVWGTDWKLCYSSPDGEYFYDSISIYSQEENIVRVVSKGVFSERVKKDLIKEFGKAQEGVTHSLSIYEFNCKDKKSRFLEYSVWSGENLFFGPIPMVTGGHLDSKWRSFDRGSSGESLFKAVCK